MTEPARTTSTEFIHLFDRDHDLRNLWRADEICAIWRHQLKTELEFDLGGLDGAAAAQLAALTTAPESRAATFGDLLFHPSAPLPLLELVKEFGKAHSAHPESLLPREVAMALYYSAIAAALVRHSRRISSLSDETLRAGMRQVLERPWLDDETGALLRAALAVL
jgi:hypothetical protein